MYTPEKNKINKNKFSNESITESNQIEYNPEELELKEKIKNYIEGKLLIKKSLFLAESITYDEYKSKALAKIAQTQAGQGKINEAVSLAESITDDRYKAEALAEIAQTQAIYSSKLIIANKININNIDECQDIFNKAIQNKDKKFIQNLGVLLPINIQSELINSLPESQQNKINRLFKIALTEMVPEKINDEEKLVLGKKYSQELNKFLDQDNINFSDNIQINLIGKILHNLDINKAKQTLLETARKHKDNLNNPALLSLFKHLIESSGLRGQDVAKELLANKNLASSRAWWFIYKLSEANYFDTKFYDKIKKDIKNKVALPENSQSDNSERYLQGIRLIINQLHLNPDKAIIDYLINKKWDVDDLEARVDQIQEHKQEFESFTSKDDLLKLLAENKDKALLYYILNGGKTRFSLVNSYSFEKFQEILEIANKFEKHEEPMNKFKKQLQDNKFSEEEINNIVKNLEQGHYPFATGKKPEFEKEIRIDISDNVKLENANKQLGNILGKNQLGVILKSPLYREYLKNKKNKKLLDELEQATDFTVRIEILTKIENKYPVIKDYAKKKLSNNWKKFGEKMILELSLDSVFDEVNNVIDGLQIIPKIEQRRMNLSRASKELLSALRGNNPKIKAIRARLSKLSNALKGLKQGYEKTNKAELRTRIVDMEEEFVVLQNQREQIMAEPAMNRWSEMSDIEKEKLIDKEVKHIKN